MTDQDLACDLDTQAALWCLQLAKGALSPPDQAMFARWMEDPIHAAAFDDAARTWHMVGDVAAAPELVHLRRDALKSYCRSHARRWMPPMPVRRFPAMAAAMLLIVALLTLTLSLRNPATSITTGIGERRIAMLEDGSRLSLDADTEVTVRLRNDRRVLQLVHGRARFDVAHDPSRPFAVSVGDKIVVATGTSFSVERVGTQFHVVLYEGHVAILNNRAGSGLSFTPAPGRQMTVERTLSPGREMTGSLGATAEALHVQTVDLQQASVWEAGQLSFDDESIGVAVARMNRYAADPLVLEGPGLSQIRVSGVFAAGDIKAFVEGLTALHPIRVDRQPGRIVLRSASSS